MESNWRSWRVGTAPFSRLAKRRLILRLLFARLGVIGVVCKQLCVAGVGWIYPPSSILWSWVGEVLYWEVVGAEGRRVSATVRPWTCRVTIDTRFSVLSILPSFRPFLSFFPSFVIFLLCPPFLLFLLSLPLSILVKGTIKSQGAFCKDPVTRARLSARR